MKVDGQCHCGAITYEAEVDPGTVMVCHCRDCQRQSGTVFRMNIPAPAQTFRITKGSPRKYLKIADSGNQRIHAFCENCGGPIYACAAQDPKNVSLRVGALNQAHELGAPTRQIWASRRFKWLAFPAEISSAEQQG